MDGTAVSTRNSTPASATSGARRACLKRRAIGRSLDTGPGAARATASFRWPVGRIAGSGTVAAITLASQVPVHGRVTELHWFNDTNNSFRPARPRTANRHSFSRRARRRLRYLRAAGVRRREQ